MRTAPGLLLIPKPSSERLLTAWGEQGRAPHWPFQDGVHTVGANCVLSVGV